MTHCGSTPPLSFEKTRRRRNIQERLLEEKRRGRKSKIYCRNCSEPFWLLLDEVSEHVDHHGLEDLQIHCLPVSLWELLLLAFLLLLLLLLLLCRVSTHDSMKCCTSFLRSVTASARVAAVHSVVFAFSSASCCRYYWNVSLFVVFIVCCRVIEQFALFSVFGC